MLAALAWIALGLLGLVVVVAIVLAVRQHRVNHQPVFPPFEPHAVDPPTDPFPHIQP